MAVTKSDSSVVAFPGKITADDLNALNSKSGLKRLLAAKRINVSKVVKTLRYEETLRKLQVELVKLQRDVEENDRRVAIIFEGRDAAGKGGTIRRFIEHLSPRHIRVVALPKPSDDGRGQWHFQRYSRQLPDPGEIVFFDRSWYNRAVVEPVNGFCSKEQYQTFLRQAPEFEHMLYEDGVEIIKFWFSITKDEQEERFRERRTNPLKQWKISPVDQRAQELWDTYTDYKEEMFSQTHTSYSPWVIVKTNSKKRARLESIRYALSRLDYKGRDDAKVNLAPHPNTVERYHRSTLND